MAETYTYEDLLARIPFQVRIHDFDADGIVFGVTNPVELYRVVGHGGETEYTQAMLDALRPDDVLYDIGTNIGLVALHAALRCRVVAFEPDPSFAERFRTNLALNPHLAVDVLPLAVSEARGVAELFTDGATGNSPSLRHQRDEQGVVSVPTITLDEVVAEGLAPPPTVLKLDIEGAEILALRGATGLLSGDQAPRALFIEIHDTFLPAFGSSHDEVRALLATHGYTREVYRAPREDQHHLILERAA